MSDNIKVVVKVRPLISREIEEKLTYQWRVRNDTLYQLDPNGRESGSCFTFDKVYDKDTKTSHVYSDIAKPIVEAAIAGFNGTIFAYGQTSSGKTYTMTGAVESPGIIQLAVLDLFEMIKRIPDRDFLVRVSYIEIYNESLKDLLDVEKEKIKIHETLQGVRVDASEKVASSPEEVLNIMKMGEANRHIGATNMNEESSRSHSIFQITIESREHIEGEEEAGCVNVSQLNLVDLAGSERAGQTGATGRRFKEGTHINKSLSVLALVIKQLSEDPNKYANYRDSKLTRILQNSLGGNAKTSIICAVTPAAVDETISTLQFANRAKAIKNKPEVNAVATNATMIQSLTKQLSKLQSQLENKKHLEQDNFNLTKQITALQRLILNGFDKSNINTMNRRKTWCAPRRQTISVLHTVEEEPTTSIPKFCTPSLKYNPLTTPGAMEFLQNQSARLPSVSEEVLSKKMTSPNKDKKVNFSDEIITLDSDDDDDESLDAQACSPYHKCYGSSKTPPCILRKNAKQAEEKLKDILDYTEIEKMYTPEVIELIGEVKTKTNTIKELEEKINNLNEKDKESESELDKLKTKLLNTEQEVKTLTNKKIELEILCKDLNTKITDLEVCYDTHKKKADGREKELLSLLEDQNKNSQSNQTIKAYEKELSQFMDMSKDISLINTDSDNSLDENEPTSELQDLIVSIHKSTTDKFTCDFNATLVDYRQKNMSLEKSKLELQGIIDTSFAQINNLTAENSLLKSKIETLNFTIENQEENLKSANIDLQSYNNMIQELQIKLNDNENINIDNNTIEKMFANEEQFITNNENLKEIIEKVISLLDCRNKEIESLKETMRDVTNSTENFLRKELIHKEFQITTLHEEVKQLQEQLNQVMETENEKIEQINVEHFRQIDNLKENLEKLTLEVTEKKTKIVDISKTNEDLLKQITIMTEKNTTLEKSNKQKIQEQFCTGKKMLYTIRDIISLLTDEPQEIPEDTNNIETIFITLSDFLKTLIVQTMDNKSAIIQTKEKLINDLATSIGKLNKEIATLKTRIETLNQTLDQVHIKNEKLALEKVQLDSNINQISNELNAKTQEVKDLESKLLEANQSYGNQRDERLSKENLKGKESSLYLEMELLQKERNLSHNNFQLEIKELQEFLEEEKKSYSQIIQTKTDEIFELRSQLSKIEARLKERDIKMTSDMQKINNSVEDKDKKLKTISHKIIDLLSKSDIKNPLTGAFGNSNLYEETLQSLTIIGNHIILSKSSDIEGNNKHQMISSEVTSEIGNVTQYKPTDFIKNNEKCQNISQNDQILRTELEALRKELHKANELMEFLKLELNKKTSEIKKMTIKINELKLQFVSHKELNNKKVDNLQTENEELKYQYLEVDKRVLEKDKMARTESHKMKEIIRTNSPQKLLTLCFNSLIDAMYPKDNSNTVTPLCSSTNSEIFKSVNQTNQCKCIELSSELKVLKKQYSELRNSMYHLESENQDLKNEQEQVKEELQLLMEPAKELQKKILNHRTILSTLTATTYAENKLLQSQLKVLHHHHRRFHMVCQRDIPALKKQLHKLQTLLHEDSLITRPLDSMQALLLPDVLLLDKNSTGTSLKNESTLDGDLLMLDTNVTLTTMDNTLTNDQTCLEITQVCCDNEATYENNQVGEPNLNNEIEFLSSNYLNVFQEMDISKEENRKEQPEQYSEKNITKINNNVDVTRPHIDTFNNFVCENCSHVDELRSAHEKLLVEVTLMLKDSSDVKCQKEHIETKYNNVLFEMEKANENANNLLEKYNVLEQELNIKTREVEKLTHAFKIKNEELKQLQEENDTLSTQVMESISECDDLRKELCIRDEKNKTMIDKSNQLEQLLSESKSANKESINTYCQQCQLKDEIIQSLKIRPAPELHSKLNRSHSDSDSSSRYNKICTLQNELHASRDDCKKLTENIATIKNQLEYSNLSAMDLDDSLGETNVFSTFTKDFDQASSTYMPHIPEECQQDIYTLDKLDCLNYYTEKTGIQKDDLNLNVKIIDVMKMLYTDIVTKHGNEVENLTNKMKCFEETKNHLQLQVDDVTSSLAKVTKDLEKQNNNMESVKNTFSTIRNDVNVINEEILKSIDTHKNCEIGTNFKDILHKLDMEFDLSTAIVFESFIGNILSKNQSELTKVVEQYTNLQESVNEVSAKLNAANDNLQETKCKLTDKENEYNVLRTQKERIHEIANAVTLDLVRRDQEWNKTIAECCKQLIELNIVSPEEVDLTASPLTNVTEVLLQRLLSELKTAKSILKANQEREDNLLQIKNSIEKELELLKMQKEKMHEINSVLTLDLVEKGKELNTQISLYAELNKIYETKIEENKVFVKLVEELSQENKMLKVVISEKEKAVMILENVTVKQKVLTENESKIAELINAIEELKRGNESLKSINDIITKEKERYASELEKSNEIIKRNNSEITKVTSDVLILKKFIKENTSVIENLKSEAKSLLEQNTRLGKQFEERSRDCARLETNIKTHEKTVEIQSNMILRLQKQKDEVVNEKDKQIENITKQFATSQNECDALKANINTLEEEIKKLKKFKDYFEGQASCELNGPKSRLSIEAIADNSRRRRQSIHDSKRMFTDDGNEYDEQYKADEIFASRQKPDDLFMDVEGGSSNRSTPIRLSRGRDSLSKQEEESPPSRPGSVQAARRRRQSTHDLHRTVTTQSIDGEREGHDSLNDELTNTKQDVNSHSEVCQLKKQLAACQQELEELKERYRELDEECETCAEYLHERDEQCARLKKEKAALENQVIELKKQLQSGNSNLNQQTVRSFADAFVNTDEDWANLHSVVVDRMSYDAEVDKNKKLTKALEEFRAKNHSLKATLYKMQNAFEKKNGAMDHTGMAKQLEATKLELEKCKQTIEALNERVKELDSECEICGEYIQERDEQIAGLKEAKAALEVKVEELQEHGSSHEAARKKRHSIHDQNRDSAVLFADATTDTTNDVLGYQAERDTSSQQELSTVQHQELQQLKRAVHQLSQQKAALEHQLMSTMAAAQHPLYVATGSAIIQNQQITDIMKENQKLKKVNAKLITICKKRGKLSNRENDDPSEQS